jgi:hypothetical protein
VNTHPGANVIKPLSVIYEFLSQARVFVTHTQTHTQTHTHTHTHTNKQTLLNYILDFLTALYQLRSLLMTKILRVI